MFKYRAIFHDFNWFYYKTPLRVLISFSDKHSRSSRQDRKRKSEQIVIETKPDVSTANKRSRSVETRKERVNEEIKKDSVKTVAKPSNVLSNCKSEKPKVEPLTDRITRKQLKSLNKLPCKVQTKESKTVVSAAKPDLKPKSTKSAKDKTVKPNPTKGLGDINTCDKTLKNNCGVDKKKSNTCDTEVTDSTPLISDIVVKEEEKETKDKKSDSLKKSEDNKKPECNELEKYVHNEEENISEITVKSEVKECSEDKTTSDKNNEDTDDNMHFMKQRLLANNNSQEKSPTPNLTEKIDVNRSVTEQLTKLAKTENRSSSLEDHHHSGKSASPSTKRLDENRYENVTATQPSHYSNSEIRSSSRASEHSGTSEDRRSGSHLEKIKNSPSSSPLVLDKTEPVHPYRDPELMKKNTVHSNVQSMHHKMSAGAYPGIPIPPPQGAGSSYQSSLPRSHLSSLYHPLAQLPAMPPAGLGIDHATYAAIQQQQLLQYNLLLQRTAAAYPANLTQQLELLWQQKHPSTPVPPQWALAKNQEELLRDLYALKEREIDRYDIKRREMVERERIEQEHLERIERDKLEREQRERQLERERQDRERLER